MCRYLESILPKVKRQKINRKPHFVQFSNGTWSALTDPPQQINSLPEWYPRTKIEVEFDPEILETACQGCDNPECICEGYILRYALKTWSNGDKQVMQFLLFEVIPEHFLCHIVTFVVFSLLRHS